MLPLYLVPEDVSLSSGARLQIEGDEAHHITKVLRHEIGEHIFVTNGRGQRATFVIESILGKSVSGLIESVEASQEARVRLRVIQGLTKSDRAHECVELLVAAGVDEIIPWRAERSIGKWDSSTSATRWDQWIKAAVKQTRRDRIPSQGSAIESLSELSIDENEILIALHEEAEEVLDSKLAAHWSERIENIQQVTLIIGPEGGLSERELALLKEMGASSLRLGTPVFRSAHAGAIALTALQASLALWR